jgi:hypothetical protein
MRNALMSSERAAFRVKHCDGAGHNNRSPPNVVRQEIDGMAAKRKENINQYGNEGKIIFSMVVKELL